MGALQQSFFGRDTLTVARELLGKKLVRAFRGRVTSGMVVEAEAYIGRTDSACHASRGRTERNAVMFGPPGVAYVYFVYGMHSMLNVVTEPEGEPCAVLLRAIVPTEGVALMERRRGRGGRELADGPAKLCQALAIDKGLNGHDLTSGEKLWFEEHRGFADGQVSRGPRVGISYAEPEDRDAPWRYWVAEPGEERGV